MQTKLRANKITCKQINMQAKEHVNIETRKEKIYRNYNVNKIICKHRNTRFKFCERVGIAKICDIECFFP